MNPEFLARARSFLDEGVLHVGDVYAVGLAAPGFGENDPERMLGLAFAVRAPRQGHAGLVLSRVKERVEAERELFSERGDGSEEGESGRNLAWPMDSAAWVRSVLASPMVGAPEDRHLPFVRQPLGDDILLLTRRLYAEQERIASALRCRASLPLPSSSAISHLDARLCQLFPTEPQGEAARAVRLAAERSLAVIVGGPGTGKTYSITRLLALLLAETSSPMVVQLAAPTGKAAVRMREAIQEATTPGALTGVSPLVTERLRGLEATTLHRLLGIRPDGSAAHNAKNPLRADVVVVDEVSMLDLVLMRRLLEAVRNDARLILLGDRDQLASVEAGCVLADLVGDGVSGVVANQVQRFTHSRRFASAPDIALIAACLQSWTPSSSEVPASAPEKIEVALGVFTGQRHARGEGSLIRVRHLGEPEIGRRPRPTEAQLDMLTAPYLEGFDATGPEQMVVHFDGYASQLAKLLRGSRSSLDQPGTQRALLDALERYRVLAAHRRGGLGVETLDRVIAARIWARLHSRRESRPPEHWAGRAILITENTYELGLMNGDVGIVLPHGEEGGLVAVFAGEQPGEVRSVSVSRLPRHEGAFAMTVHKAQGSQYEHVALVLAGKPSPIQTRELVYTGVTRAKMLLSWLGTEEELRRALEQQVDRASGLEELLRA